MNDPRVAVVSSHGAVHKPTCYALAKLKKPTRTTSVVPESHGWWGVVEVGGGSLGVASCCYRHFRTTEVLSRVWTVNEGGTT